MPASPAPLLEVSFARDIVPWLLAWARVLPAVTLVPAFGLKAMPRPVRVALALALGAALAPGIRAEEPSSSAPLPLLVLEQILRGLPVAVSAAVALWTAQMAGGLVDDLRAGRDRVQLPHVEPGTTPLGALLGTLAALGFLLSGGASQLALQLSEAPRVSEPLVARVALHLTRGIELAVALAAPLVAASVLLEIGGALIARAAAPAQVQTLIAPLRSLALLLIFGLLLERIVAALALGSL
jgi:type III secretory pathway component EscT